MTFGVIYRDRSRRGANAEGLIASGGRWLCQDWQCPAKVSCAKAWGRSRAYAAMADYTGALLHPERDPDAEACAHYERDTPRAWLQPGPNQHISALPPAIGLTR